MKLETAGVPRPPGAGALKGNARLADISSMRIPRWLKILALASLVAEAAAAAAVFWHTR